jgi:hypothetical protein
LSHSLSLFCYPPVADSIPPKGADTLIAQPDDSNASHAKSSGDSSAMAITTGEGPKGVLLHSSLLTKKERKAAKKSALKEAKKAAKRAAKIEEKKEAKRAAKMEEKKAAKKEAKRLKRAASTTTGTSPAQIEVSNKRQENAGAAFSHSFM